MIKKFSIFFLLYYIFNKQTQNRLTASKLGKNKINEIAY